MSGAIGGTPAIMAMIYAHVLNRGGREVQSPLDLL